MACANRPPRLIRREDGLRPGDTTSRDIGTVCSGHPEDASATPESTFFRVRAAFPGLAFGLI